MSRFNPLDLLFPRSNARHSSISTYLTPTEITALPSKFKALNKSQSKYFAGVFVAAPYDNYVVQDLLTRTKQDGETAIIKSFTDLIHQKIFADADFFVPDPDVIVPVPTDPERLLTRGFALPHRLSAELTRRIDSAVYLDALVKTQSTRPQGELDRRERLTNLRGVFSLRPDLPSLSTAEILWLVDDITTTGTTLTQAAKLLKKQFPFLTIYGITIAGN